MPDWTNETDYPVYHDVFFYNPDVRRFIVTIVTGRTPAPEPVITSDELVDLLTSLAGR